MARTWKDTPKAKNFRWLLRDSFEVKHPTAFHRATEGERKGNIETRSNQLSAARA
jgi:hypothetical protein